MDVRRALPTDFLARAQFRRWFGRYFLAAVAVFALGAVLGAVVTATTDLSGLSDFAGNSNIFPAEFTVAALVVNNLQAVGVTALGLVSFGIIALASLLLNGLIIGIVLAGAAGEGNLLLAVALIVPHGVIELSAFWLVAALSFRVTHRFINYLRGVDDRAITRQEVGEVAVLLVVAAVAIVVAAVIEVHVTPAVGDALQ